MNNTPDYEDNLAFEPEMTWEDFCNKWRSNEEVYVSDSCLSFNLITGDHLVFEPFGQVYVETEARDSTDDIFGVPCYLAEDVTVDEMDTLLTIIQRRNG